MGAYEITEKTMKEAYKPYDIVTDKHGNVGFIQETKLSDCQPEGSCQVGYSVKWIVKKTINLHSAWYDTEDLTRHCNLFVKIAECSCHPFSNNSGKVKELLSTGI